jgi:hypothetical protein
VNFCRGGKGRPASSPQPLCSAALLLSSGCCIGGEALRTSPLALTSRFSGRAHGHIFEQRQSPSAAGSPLNAKSLDGSRQLS